MDWEKEGTRGMGGGGEREVAEEKAFIFHAFGERSTYEAS